MSEILKKHLGPNSYQCIVDEVHNKLLHSNADTITGKDILDQAFKNLNESTTPILTLKTFTTNAQQLAPHDAKLCEIVDFVSNKVKSGDLNFLVNVCKEEHYRNLSRTGFPGVDETIEDIKDEFNQPSSVVETLIQKGIFDKLQSNLLMEIKSDLPEGRTPIITDVEINQLNESIYLGNDTYIYNPLGVRYIDRQSEKQILLFEHNKFEVTRNGLVPLMESIDIPAAHQRLTSALQELPYDIEEQMFGMSMDWDFNFRLLNSGKVAMDLNGSESGVYVEPGDVQDILFESIGKYIAEGKIPNDSVKAQYMRDADNFVMLAENHNKLILVDEVKVIKNTKNNDTVLLNESLITPNVLLTNTPLKVEFGTFKELNESINTTMGINVDKLFEGLKETENVIINTRGVIINSLFEDQNTLNSLITENDNLLTVAEKDSPAYSKLFENQNLLTKKLDDNLEMLKTLNSFDTLYESTSSILGKGAEHVVQKTLGVNKPVRAAINGYNKVSKAILQTQQDIEQLKQNVPVSNASNTNDICGINNVDKSNYLGDLLYKNMQNMDNLDVNDKYARKLEALNKRKTDDTNLNEGWEDSKNVNKFIKGAAVLGAAHTIYSVGKDVYKEVKKNKKTNESTQQQAWEVNLDNLNESTQQQAWEVNLDNLNEGTAMKSAVKYYDENKDSNADKTGRKVGKGIKQTSNKIKNNAGKVISTPARFARGVTKGLKQSQQQTTEDLEDFQENELDESIALTTAAATVGAYHADKYAYNKLKK